ncbi:MAG: acetyl-CoA carboxylase biotin carboxylase subunit [Streptomycetales bacterium]
MSFHRVLVADRGEIAVRVVRACQALGIESVVAVSETDKDSLAARLADRSVCIGPAPASRSYLKQEALLAAALGTGVDAIHPGYGFLAENPTFAEACESQGIRFVGPRAETIRTMGNKLTARETAERYQVPVVPGSPRVDRFEDAETIVGDIGYPVLLKAAAGGGGRGIRIVHDPSEMRSRFLSATAEAAAAFGNGALYIERYIPAARHIEVQVFADRYGQLLQLGERDCSIQRRYQKIIEEAPAASIPDDVRGSIRAAAVALTDAIGYENAGTVEFIYDEECKEYYFLEMNTRIQVEHPVTEEITGLDLVQMQLQVGSGQGLPLQQEDVRFTGHAIECRVTAESPEKGFRPSPGRLVTWQPPEGPGIRLDSHCYEGYRVPPFYDSLLGKLITHGRDRAEALERMRAALRRFGVAGIDTTIGVLTFLTEQPDFQSGRFNTRWAESTLDLFRSGMAGS